MKRCPHQDVQFCPLYVAMHVAGAGSCDDGHLWDGRCAVDRGRMSYEGCVARLRVSHPGLVEAAEWRRDLAERAAQRARNVRLNGLH